MRGGLRRYGNKNSHPLRYLPLVPRENCGHQGVPMHKTIVTTKGQLTIPSRLRDRLGIRKGTQVCLYERDGEIVIRAITDEYIRSMAGFTGTKGRLLEALRDEKLKG